MTFSSVTCVKQHAPQSHDTPRSPPGHHAGRVLTMNTFFLILVSMLTGTVVATDRVAVVELNSVYCAESGSDVLCQYVWWDLARYPTCFVVVDWRLSKDAPTPQSVDGKWVQEWYDKKTGIYRRVEAREFRLRDLPFDAEMKQRDIVPECRRRGLRK